MAIEVTYKDPLYVGVWLKTALDKEWQKYDAVPVVPDYAPGHDLAQAWGFVVAGYFLIEQGLKAILFVSGGKPTKTHGLAGLFDKLRKSNQDTLSRCYEDFRHVFPGMLQFPPRTLRDFLVNLDGAPDGGNHIGSLDWRYFLTEERRGESMPLVSIDAMHEVALACVHLVQSRGKDDRARANTYSLRLHRRRHSAYMDRLNEELSASEWPEERDRLEVLWGPDYRGRHDYIVYQGKNAQSVFGLLPNFDELPYPVVDRRRELGLLGEQEVRPNTGPKRNSPVPDGSDVYRHVLH